MCGEGGGIGWLCIQTLGDLGGSSRGIIRLPDFLLFETGIMRAG